MSKLKVDRAIRFLELSKTQNKACCRNGVGNHSQCSISDPRHYIEASILAAIVKLQSAAFGV